MPKPDVNAYDPLTPVPAERRVFTFRDAFALWFSLGIGLLVLQAGALLVPGLSLPMALGAILVGTVLGVLLLAAAGMVGADTGLSAIGSLRPALGVRGASVPAVLNALQLTGWGAFEIVAMRDSANALSMQTFGYSSPIAWTLAFGAAATALAILGPVSFVRRFLRDWGLWLLLAGAAYLTWRLLASHDLAELWSRPAKGGLSFGGGVDLVVAMPLSWLPLIADYTRFGRSPRSMFRGSALGYLVANLWFYGLGASYALAGGGGALLTTALAAAGGGAALLLILIDETDNAFADVFSAAVSTGVLVKAPIWRLSLFFGVLCTAIALLIPLARYETFLLTIGSLFAPLFGVLLTDHFVLRKRRIEAAAINEKGGAYWFTGGWKISGLLAWAVGVAAYQVISRQWPDLGATLPSLAIAAFAYLAMARPSAGSPS